MFDYREAVDTGGLMSYAVSLTAKALGLTSPQPVLIQADEVIQ